jgi:4a-hydroxytetrahydrobiopterin dehydratase
VTEGRPVLLSDVERREALSALPGWIEADDGRTIRKRYTFKAFDGAFGFMTRVALAAERLDHHPEWSNVYNRVDVSLSTHSAGGITALDIRLAKKMESVAREIEG